MSNVTPLSPISATEPMAAEMDDTIGLIAPAVTLGGLATAFVVGGALGAVAGTALVAAYATGYQDGQEAATSGDKPKNR